MTAKAKRQKKHEIRNNNFNSSYRRTNISVNKKTIHCIHALEDILDTVFSKNSIKLECYYTINAVIFRIDGTSYRLTTPIYNEDIINYIKGLYINKQLDKNKLTEYILKSTNLENIVKDHCMSCVKMGSCSAYNTYLTL